MEEAILIEIALLPADRSRGRHNPRAVKRKMSHFPTKSRAQPLLPPKQRLIYAEHISLLPRYPLSVQATRRAPISV